MDTGPVSQSVFKPNVIDMPSAQLLTGGGLAELQPSATVPEERDWAALLPSGAEAVRIKINTVQIMGGLEPGFLGLAPPKGAYLVATVVDGLSQEPIQFTGKGYEGLRNGDVLPLGEEGERDAPLTVYLREWELPRVLGVSVCVFRSNQNLRDAGALITEVMGNSRFGKLSEIVATAVTAAVPAYGIVWQAANEVIGIVGSILKSTPDEQLGYYEARYTNRFDDLGIGHHPPEGPGRTIPVGRIRLAYQIDVV